MQGKCFNLGGSNRFTSGNSELLNLPKCQENPPGFHFSAYSAFLVLALLLSFSTPSTLADNTDIGTSSADSAMAHWQTGHALSLSNDFPGAIKEFQLAANLAPDNVDILLNLAAAYDGANKKSEELTVFLGALNKTNLTKLQNQYIRSFLSAAYWSLGQTAQAKSILAPLPEADFANDPRVEVNTWQAYSNLRKKRAAVKHAEKFLSLCQTNHDLELEPRQINNVSNWLAYARETSVPYYISNAPPRPYSADEFKDAIVAKLSPETAKLLVYPFACTEAMTNWARDITSGATNDLQKAQLLFDEFCVSRPPRPIGQIRNAQQVFAEWKDPTAYFPCEELTDFYVTVGRAVGLKVYNALILEDKDGTRVDHSCAALFLREHALLVDPAYEWFGIPHKKFIVCDDLQSASSFFYEHTVVSCRAACKLFPESPLANLNLFEVLTDNHLWDAARESMTNVINLDPASPRALYVKAAMLVVDGNFEPAIKLLEQAIKINPQAAFYIQLGAIYAMQGKGDAARIAYSNALPLCPFECQLAQAHRCLESLAPTNSHYYLNLAFGCNAKKEWPGTIENCGKSIALDSKLLAAFILRATALRNKGDLDKALDDLTLAIQINPRCVQAYSDRALIQQLKGDLTAAMADNQLALELDATCYMSAFNLGSINANLGNLDRALHYFEQAFNSNPNIQPSPSAVYCEIGRREYDQHDFSAAAQCLQKACQFDSADISNHIILWLAESRAGDFSNADQTLKSFLRSRIKVPADRWNLNICDFLVGTISESKFFAAARDQNARLNAIQNAQAWFFAGSKHLINGDKIEAGYYFQKCLADTSLALPEQRTASTELDSGIKALLALHTFISPVASP